MRWTLLLGAATLCWATPLDAQSQPLDSAALEALQRVLRLPQTTAEAREAGATDSIIRIVLREARRRGVPAGDAQAAVEAETEAVKAGAPKENFGAFVQAQLAAGKRGRALAEAIRAEHAKRGHGPKGAGAMEGRRPGGPPGTKDEMDAAGRGKADSAAKGRGRRQ